MYRRILAALTVAILAVGCTEKSGTPTDPVGADGPTAADPVPQPEAPVPASSEQARLEALARRMAMALRSPDVRATVRQDLADSPVREHKLYVREFLAARHSMFEATDLPGSPASATMASLAGQAQETELYFPVPRHRRAWQGDEHLLVATALDDFDPPVAFDVEGRRYVLDPMTPPDIPVLALVPREASRPGPMPAAKCQGDCWQPWGKGGGGTGGGGGTPSVSAGALTLTHAEFVDDFEGWLKGKPEYEIHILGPVSETDTTTMVSYQCVGEHAPPGYVWDMNDQVWDGSQQLFTFDQMDTFEKAHPTRAYLVFAVEDDTDACRITGSNGQFKNMLDLLSQVYDKYTGLKDKKIGLDEVNRILQAAKSGAKLLSAIGNFITTPDDPIGIAVADTVAGRFNPRANWVVLDEHNQVNGWLNLVMR